MDAPSISVLAAATLTVLQPYLPLIAARAAEELGKSLPAAVGKVWHALKKRMDTKEAAREALEDLLKKPDNEAFQTVFKVQLEKLVEKDEGFREQLQTLVKEAGGGGDIHVAARGVFVGRDAKKTIIITGDHSQGKQE